MRDIQALRLHWKQKQDVGGCTREKCCWNIRCAVSEAFRICTVARISQAVKLVKEAVVLCFVRFTTGERHPLKQGAMSS